MTLIKFNHIATLYTISPSKYLHFNNVTVFIHILLTWRRNNTIVYSLRRGTDTHVNNYKL